MDNSELEHALAKFVGAFEIVFGSEWNYSKEILNERLSPVIERDGTFLEPGVDLDNSNWGARAALLKSYQQLQQVMRKQSIEPKKPVRDAYFVYSWPE